MDWYLILAIAIPFLFVIGVINNAIKDQRKLEKGKLQGFLRKRVGKSDQPYDDDDDWGVKARQDLKKAVEETSSSNQAKVLKGAKHDGNNSNIEPGQELEQGVGQERSEQDRMVSDLSQNNPLSNKTVDNFKPLGDTKAKNASDYFANYYKQSYTSTKTSLVHFPLWNLKPLFYLSKDNYDTEGFSSQPPWCVYNAKSQADDVPCVMRHAPCAMCHGPWGLSWALGMMRWHEKIADEDEGGPNLLEGRAQECARLLRL